MSQDLAACRAHFDVPMIAFGPDRLAWGSDRPACNLGGSFAERIRLAGADSGPR